MPARARKSAHLPGHADVHNAEVARIFNQIADLLEFQGANPFRIRAYRNAAYAVSNLARPVREMVEAGEDLTELKGIGNDLATKITEIVKTGRLAFLDDIAKNAPEGLADLVNVPGLGAKRVKLLSEALGVRNLRDLRRVARSGEMARLPGFGEKLAAKIAVGAEWFESRGSRGRVAWMEADALASPLVAALRTVPGVLQAVAAGSYRRKRETVGDLDILVVTNRPAPVMEAFARYGGMAKILSRGQTKASGRLKSGLQVDVEIVPPESAGAAALYFTGSREHNIDLRKRAIAIGCKLNEYGLFRSSERIAGATEEEVYEALSLPFIPPELRENRGEIETAEKGLLPHLIEIGDIRGDLHSHTLESDGADTLENMAAAAKAMGYEYLAVTEHSQKVKVARGLDGKRLLKHIGRIDALNGKLKGIRLLKGIEVDILEDGSLDLPDAILSELDVRVCSVHYKMEMNRQKMTERLLRAMDNRHFNILGHPTSRMIFHRPGFEFDFEKVLTAAKERGCIMELNCQPERMDLDDVRCRTAKEAGVKIAVSSDAHGVGNLRYMTAGIGQARRGWLEKKDVINTLPLTALLRLFKR